jgi:phosphate transport system substrate-binding protein
MIIAVAVVGCLCFAGGYMLGNSGDDEDREVIVTAGSTTIQPLMGLLKEEYEKDHKVDIRISGGGSSAGISTSQNGTADIGMVSRVLTTAEKEGSATVPALKEHQIAMDAVVIIVNVNVYNGGVTNITQAQLQSIYASAGTATSWTDIFPGYTGSSAFAPIDREGGSGTRDTFDSIVLGSSSAAHKTGIPVQSSAGGMMMQVNSTPGSIGYVGMDMLDHLEPNVRVLTVGGVTPTDATVQDKSYTLNRYLVLCTNGDPTGAVKDFIDWIRSPAGQNVVKEGGFVKLP